MANLGKGREALVACSDRNMGTGIAIWDLQTGDRLTHIPTCASPPHGLLCLKDQFLLASQVNKHGSVGGGAVFAWPLNKPQSPILSYPIEGIGPICCSMDGVYLAGGATSGNAYIWEVASGRLLKRWHAHQTSLKGMVFSNDDSFLISGSDDGMICVWSMIRGPITALTFSTLGLISASEDCTVCLWDASSWATILKFNYQKGPVTNILVIPYSSLLPSSKHQRTQHQFHVSVLEKCPQPSKLLKGTITFIRSCSSRTDNETSVDFSTGSLAHQIFEMEDGYTPAALQMKVETSINHRTWATRMTKHVMEMNKHLQTRLLDLMQTRLLRSTENDSATTRKNKKHKITTPLFLEEKLL